MQITITARHFDLTNAIRDHVYDSSEKMEKFFDHLIDAQFILSFENHLSNVELLVHAPKHTLKSETVNKDMYLAIDDAIDKMVQQIKKMKERWDNHHKKSIRENSDFVYANLIKQGEKKQRVNVKRIVAENLMVNDAIDRFNEINEPYFVFKNIETDRVNVVVKKDDDHFKLIEP